MDYNNNKTCIKTMPQGVHNVKQRFHNLSRFHHQVLIYIFFADSFLNKHRKMKNISVICAMSKTVSVVQKRRLESNPTQCEFSFITWLLNSLCTFAQVQKQPICMKELKVETFDLLFKVELQKRYLLLFFYRSNDAPAASFPTIQHATSWQPTLPGTATTYGNDGPS